MRAFVSAPPGRRGPSILEVHPSDSGAVIELSRIFGEGSTDPAAANAVGAVRLGAGLAPVGELHGSNDLWR